MKQLWLTILESGVALTLLGLGLEFYRQWLATKKEKEVETKRQIQEARNSAKERAEIKKDIFFIKEKLDYVLELISRNSSFK